MYCLFSVCQELLLFQCLAQWNNTGEMSQRRQLHFWFRYVNQHSVPLKACVLNCTQSQYKLWIHFAVNSELPAFVLNQILISLHSTLWDSPSITRCDQWLRQNAELWSLLAGGHKFSPLAHNLAVEIRQGVKCCCQNESLSFLLYTYSLLGKSACLYSRQIERSHKIWPHGCSGSGWTWAWMAAVGTGRWLLQEE